jgi:hypothetical protein
MANAAPPAPEVDPWKAPPGIDLPAVEMPDPNATATCAMRRCISTIAMQLLMYTSDGCISTTTATDSISWPVLTIDSNGGMIARARCGQPRRRSPTYRLQGLAYMLAWRACVPGAGQSFQVMGDG